MALTIHDPADPRLPERAEPMAKADLRKAERQMVGAAIEGVRLLAKLSLKEFAATLDRDARQVARWIDGSERPQLDAILAVEAFKPLLVVAFARVAAGRHVDVVTEIRVKDVA